MAGSVETITAHTVLRIEFVRQRIHISIVRHRLMERCIEHTHLWNVGQQRAHGIHTLDVSRVMEGSQIVTSSKGFHHLGSEQHRLVELLTTMHHAVTYSVQLVKALQYSIFTLCQDLKNPLHTFRMLLHRLFHLMLLPVQLYRDERVRQTNLFYTTRRDHALIRHVIQCIFDR